MNIASAREWSFNSGDAGGRGVATHVSEQFSRPMMYVYRVNLQGTIAAGKSTVIEKLHTRPELVRSLLGDAIAQTIPRDAVFVYCPEPVELWQNCNGIDLLGEFYKDQTRWSTTFQLWALQTRIMAMNSAVLSALQHQPRANPSAVVLVCERSIDTDAAVFAPMLRDAGKITPAEWRVYGTAIPTHEHYFRCLLAEELRRAGLRFGFLAVVDLAEVYLRIEPEQAFARVQKRARGSEVGSASALTLDYMRALHLQHERVFAGPEFNGIPVVTLEPDELARRLQ
jgi:deoxycitidine kinase/deoxyguanosine kinase